MTAVSCHHRKEMQTVLSSFNWFAPCFGCLSSDLGPSDRAHELSELISLDINDFPFLPNIGLSWPKSFYNDQLLLYSQKAVSVNC